MALQSTTPNGLKKSNNRRGLLTTGVIAGAALLALYSGRPFLGYSATTATVVATVPVTDVGALAVGQALTFDSQFGKVALNVTGITGDMVTVTDAEGDTITVNREELTGGTLPASDTKANAKRMLSVIAQRAESGYYVRHDGVNGAHGK